MSAARYVYGCSTDGAKGFGVSLGKGVKITHLAKIDVQTLIERGKENPPEKISGCVDSRSLEQVIKSEDPEDPIKIFSMPEGWYAQEASFVPRQPAQPPSPGGRRIPPMAEDDGYLLTYVFDESQIDPGTAMPCDGAASELWVIDARNMRDVICRVSLPQRVPYGLHGNWFSESQIKHQRQITSIRNLPETAFEAHEAARDEETRVQSPSQEKSNPFDAIPEHTASTTERIAATKETARPISTLQRTRSQRAVAAALSPRKWSPAWRTWMSFRESIERKLG